MKRTLGVCYYPEHWPETQWPKMPPAWRAGPDMGQDRRIRLEPDGAGAGPDGLGLAGSRD